MLPDSSAAPRIAIKLRITMSGTIQYTFCFEANRMNWRKSLQEYAIFLIDQSFPRGEFGSAELGPFLAPCEPGPSSFSRRNGPSESASIPVRMKHCRASSGVQTIGSSRTLKLVFTMTPQPVFSSTALSSR